MYKVRFYQGNGKSPIKDFVNSCQRSLGLKIARQISYLQEFGLTNANPSLKKLAGTPLWEARILGKDGLQIICAAVINHEIVIVHIFKKKSNKMPMRDLKISLKRYKEEFDK